MFEILCFSHCKDKVYFATLQTFSRKIVLDIASRQPNGDKPCYTPSESVVPISKNSQKKRSEHRVGRQSAPSYRASTLSPVRVFHTFAQTLCRPIEHSIHSRKHSVARQSTPSNHIKHPVAHQNAIRRRRSKICNDFRIFDDEYSQKKRPEL